MDQLQRLQLLVGEQNINKINAKTILIVGLGGVGSYATESLTRCGVKKLILVDADKIDITNLNRQLMTNHNNIGEFKTDVWKKRIHEINPNIQVKLITEFVTKENIDILFKENIDYIVDACDTIETKKELIRKSIEKNIKIISSMGTGNKMDPSKLKIVDIRKTNYDPLAKIIRKMVRDEKINKKINVIYSDEQPIKVKGKIGSNSFVPATAGLLCASYIINDIVKE